MTKQQAIQALIHGFAITHTFFDKDEWVKLDGENPTDLVDEKGYHLDWDEFWSYRKAVCFDEGWDVKDITVSWEVAKTKVHDASGCANPEFFKWDKIQGVYYPVSEIFQKKIEECDHTGKRVMDECGGDGESGPITTSHCVDCGKVFTQFGM